MKSITINRHYTQAGELIHGYDNYAIGDVVKCTTGRYEGEIRTILDFDLTSSEVLLDNDVSVTESTDYQIRINRTCLQDDWVLEREASQ